MFSASFTTNQLMMNQKTKILLTEDDPALAEALRFTAAGFGIG